MALVKCPCALRLRRVAQNVRFISGAWHLFPKFLHQIALVTSQCAFDCLYRNLAKRPLIGSLLSLERSCQETSYGNSCQQSSYRDCVQRSSRLLPHDSSSRAVAAASRTAPAVCFHSTACAQHNCDSSMQKQLQLRKSVPCHTINPQSLDVYPSVSNPLNLPLIPESGLFGLNESQGPTLDQLGPRRPWPFAPHPESCQSLARAGEVLRTSPPAVPRRPSRHIGGFV